MRIYVGASLVTRLEHDEEPRPDMYIECPGCKTETRILDFYPEKTKGTLPLTLGSINAMQLIEFIGQFAMEHSGCPNE